jgi:ADP-heptose:LPS heptosyltransferase
MAPGRAGSTAHGGRGIRQGLAFARPRSRFAKDELGGRRNAARMEFLSCRIAFLLQKQMIPKRGSAALHFLDRYAGIPTVVILGCSRRKRALPSSIQTFGLLRTAAIGDTVLISAAIADLRERFPDANVIFFAGPSNFEMARMLDGVDRVVELPVVNLASALRRVRSIAVDVMIDFGQWPRLDALLALLSRASFTIGFETRGQHRHFGYDLTVEHSSHVHEIENYRRLVRALGVKAGNPPSLPVPSTGASPPADYAVFHLWPGGRRKKLKQWPEEKWLALVEEIVSWEVEIVLTGAPADSAANDAMIERAGPHARRFVRNAAGLKLQETAALLAHSRLVVSVDTGVMHMAAALGAPLVALHGPTSSRRWGPISERAIAIDSALAGSGYLNLGWEYPERPLACMECISYESVRDACRCVIERQVEPVQLVRSL